MVFFSLDLNHTIQTVCDFPLCLLSQHALYISHLKEDAFGLEPKDNTEQGKILL